MTNQINFIVLNNKSFAKCFEKLMYAFRIQLKKLKMPKSAPN